MTLAACVSQQTHRAEVTKVNQNQALTQQLHKDLSADQVQVTALPNQVKVTMVDSVLFSEGGWQIHRKGEEALNKIVPPLKTIKSGRIVAEGHTDNWPIGPALRARFPSNWELSTARAADVVRYVAEQGVSRNLLAAEGFGDTRPVASNDTPEGRAKNRRVEIVISGLSQ